MKNYVLNSKDFTVLNESLSENKSIAEAFLKVGPIRMKDGTVHQPSEFIDIVNVAFMMFDKKHPWEYNFIRYARIVYLLDGLITGTMCVDDKGDLYINVEFIYSFLKMNPKYIMYILYHEAMHNILNHVRRSIDYNKKNPNNKLTWTEMNVCTDLEVNNQMVSDRICSANDWYDLHGCYDPAYKGLTFEIIANQKNKIKNVETEMSWDTGKNNSDEQNEEHDDNYKRGVEEMENAIKRLLQQNGDDKAKTKNALMDIYAKTQKPDEILKEIETMLNDKSTFQYMLYESDSDNDSWINGLQDGFDTMMASLYDLDNNESQESDNGDQSDNTESDESSNAPSDESDDENEEDSDESEDEKFDKNTESDELNNETNGLNSSSDEDENTEGLHTDSETQRNPQANGLKGELDRTSDLDSSDMDNTSDDENYAKTSGLESANTMIGRIVKHSEIEQNLQDSLKESGYDTDDIMSIYDEILSRPTPSKTEMTSLRDEIIMNKKNSALADLCMKVNVDETVLNEVWDELVKKFLQRNTTRRGSDNTMEDKKDIRWGNKRYLSMDDIIMPYHGKTSAAPQYINIFIDCSGSINADTCLYFLSVIEGLCTKLEFSGLRLIPFSDKVEESKIAGCTAEDLEDPKTKENLEAVINDYAMNMYGGGGNSTSFLCIARHIAKCELAEPESVYLVMTDGGLFDTHNIIKLKPFSERVLFCICDRDIEDTLKNRGDRGNVGGYLSWCINPKFNFLEKVYIDLDKVDMK